VRFLLGIDPTEESESAPCTSAEFIRAFHDALFYTMFRIVLDRVWPLVPQKKYLKACKTAHDYLDYYIDRALSQHASAENDKSGSLVDNLAHQTEDRHFIRHQILQGMMASQETTSALLGNACFLLSRHPQYWQEVRSAAKTPQNAVLEFDSLSNLRSVRHILLETLRLYPVFPIMQRVALHDTELPTGGGPNHNLPVFAPRGTNVTMSWFALHRDPNVFGDDVETFRPERWETISPASWEFMAFGGGNRSCMGQQKVLVEAAYVLMRLARRYDRIESRDSSAWEGELKLTCKNKNGCKVALFRGDGAEN
jgi:cytochrome P450